MCVNYLIYNRCCNSERLLKYYDCFKYNNKCTFLYEMCFYE